MEFFSRIRNSPPYRSVETLWSSQPIVWLLVFIFALVFVYWFHSTPTPGKAVAALAVGAAVMTFREGLKPLEKFVWMGLLFGLLFIEIKSINEDRAEATAAALEARAAQEQEFRTVLQQDRSGFLEAITRMNGLAELSQKNLSGVYSSLAIITGGDSWPAFSPSVSFNSDNPADAEVSFSLIIHGQNPLRTLHVNFARATCNFDPKSQTADLAGPYTYSQSFDSFMSPPQIDGDWDPSMHPFTTTNRTPVYQLVNHRGVFTSNAAAINGHWESVIKLRQQGHRWAWRVVVYKINSDKSTYVIQDTHNEYFPSEELQRPIHPLTKDDCIAP